MRLVDADALTQTIMKLESWNVPDFVYESINNAPTVDAVRVVRCKDCKWGTPHPEGDEYTKCFKLCTTFFSGHYCAWGERREDAETD